MSDLHVVVLAAGKGTRMKSALPKVLHRVAGRPMINFVLEASRSLKPASTTVVIGHQAQLVRSTIAGHADVQTVVQEPQSGTGHALLTTEAILQDRTGHVLLLSGDVPLLRAETLESLVVTHINGDARATVATAILAHP